jgi:hypothetical protein
MNATIMFETTCLPLPITSRSKDTAQRFSQGQSTPEKSRQVQLNTLAVCVVRDYLELMAIDVDLSQSDSWNRGMQTVLDTADIMLPGLGRVECRPLVQPLESLNSSSTCTVPIEVQADRIGYVVVQISEDEQVANILGFSPTVAGETLTLKQLQPIEALIDLIPEPIPNLIASALRPLSQWFSDLVTTGWETLDTLLPNQPVLAFRDRYQRGKVIHLYPHNEAEALSLGLVMGLQKKSSGLDVLVQLLPMGGRSLPSQVKLMLIDPVNNQVIQTAIAQEADVLLQAQLEGEPGESFAVEVQWEGDSVTESFTI